MFLGIGVLKICNKFTREYPCGSVILIKLLCNFIEITLWHGCSPVNLQHIFRTSFYKDNYGGLILKKAKVIQFCKNEIAQIASVTKYMTEH